MTYPTYYTSTQSQPLFISLTLITQITQITLITLITLITDLFIHLFFFAGYPFFSLLFSCSIFLEFVLASQLPYPNT